MKIPPSIRWLLTTDTFSPLGLCLRAGIIVVIFVVMEILGLRDYTSVISGTSPVGNPADQTATLIGFAYILAWFSFVLFVPTLIMGAILMKVARKIIDSRSASSK